MFSVLVKQVWGITGVVIIPCLIQTGMEDWSYFQSYLNECEHNLRCEITFEHAVMQ